MHGFLKGDSVVMDGLVYGAIFWLRTVTRVLKEPLKYYTACLYPHSGFVSQTRFGWCFVQTIGRCDELLLWGE